MTFTAVLLALFGWTTWLFQFFFVAGWTLVKALLWAMSPVWLWAAIIGVASALFTAPAQAGWFWGPDPKVEAANRALERAAQIATDAARTQSGQQGQLLAAIEALSSERTQLAGHLHHFGEIAARDSAWAAALQAAGPVLVAVVVLALGCAAIWMVTRASDRDGQLATVLVDEITGGGPGTLLAASGHGSPQIGSPGLSPHHPARNLIDIKPSPEESAESLEEQELPF